jgi:hypothetical protein
MRTLRLALLASLSAPILLAGSAAAMDRKEVEQIVREYLLANPEILIEMSNALDAK